ncbi:hypothetical protein CURE108131_08625 [Cupriavidus respiraculi]|uniref:F-box domain-containing protein n=1 Tax=Cupriavidus respiraculi TaxID=195930 RepID=A0ABN7Y5J7_9BURK|nr:hypothetical protein [Cupriavidus respiraculi]CAG9168443.1 hypothetical protein LMG21510_01074 [Cupriavidus respiraculi]
MPIDHAITSYASTAIARHAQSAPDKPPPGAREGAAAAGANSVEARYRRARRAIEDDRQRAVDARRPRHCCALLNSIADHHIETIASYLTPRDRVNLRQASSRLRDALRNDASLDRLTIKIAKVFSPSLLRRTLTEIDRFPIARPSLIALLPERLMRFCPPHALRGLRMMVDAIETLPVEQRAGPLASTGALLRDRQRGRAVHHRDHRTMEARVMAAIQRLPTALRGRPLAAVLDAASTAYTDRTARARDMLLQLDEYPPDERAALLVALIEQFDHLCGAPDNALWDGMVDVALALPPPCQPEPLRALASHPGAAPTLARERWDHLAQLCPMLPEESRTAICRGLAGTLLRLPNVRCVPDTRPRVEWLIRAIGDLPTASRLPVLEALAPNLLRAGFGDCWERVLRYIRDLPCERRAGPLRALGRGMWEAQARDVEAHFSPTLLAEARELPPQDVAPLLGEFVERAGTLGELDRLFDACLALPLALRRWALAALARKPCWVFADNAKPICHVMLPMIDGMDAAHRAQVVGALLETAFHCRDACREDVPTRGMPATTWLALERTFDGLPPEHKEQVLLGMTELIKDPMTPAWNWILQSTRKLPAAHQPQVLWLLASVPYLTETLADIRPVRMVAAAIGALPRHYRSMPLWAVQRARDNTDDNPLAVISHLQCRWSIFRQAASLPDEDRL